MGQSSASHGALIGGHDCIHCTTACLYRFQCRIANECFRVLKRYSGFNLEYEYGFDLYKQTISGPGNAGQPRYFDDMR